MEEHDYRSVGIASIDEMHPEVLASIVTRRHRDEAAAARIVADGGQDLGGIGFGRAENFHQNSTLLVSVSERAMSSKAGSAMTT